jgi:hypothetical protein
LLVANRPTRRGLILEVQVAKLVNAGVAMRVPSTRGDIAHGHFVFGWNFGFAIALNELRGVAKRCS